jgi:KDO2-lipid IV(A) lauroyltransferase
MNRNIESVNNVFYLSLFFIFSSIVPRSIHRGFIAIGGAILSYVMKDTRKLIERNLAVIGDGKYAGKEMERMVKNTFKNYGKYLLDYMTMHRIEKNNIHNYIEIGEIGGENLLHAMKEGKGVICVTPHLGNWELGGIVLALRGYKLNALSLRDTNDRISKFREHIRFKNMINSIYIDSDNIYTITNVISALRRNEIVAALADREDSSRTIEVNFFGRRTNFPAGIAYLALASGAPIVPVFVVLRNSGKYQGIIEKPIRFDNCNASMRDAVIKIGVQEMASVFERYIREYPDQWYNFYPYWSS